MIDEAVVTLSRWQFAITSMYHFIFVPLTLGLSFILAIMETTFMLSGKEIYRNMTKFWGKLFGINFALGVTTGIAMEFQFGTNWAYYSHYVGDIFGAPLAIEALMAFFLEATLFGLFFFGWEKLSPAKHLLVTWGLAIGASMSALWILVANAWMQNPVGAEFNYQTMRMELVDFGALIFNPVAQVKFVHTVAAGYLTGSVFVLSIASYYLLKGVHIDVAKRSFAIAAPFGLAACFSVILLGDESGYELGDVQRVKLAAVEAEWHTEEPPAAFTVIGFPDQELEETHFAIRIPAMLGIIATRSLDEEVTGIKELKVLHRQRIINGVYAYELLQKLRAGTATEGEKTNFEEVKTDLGYGLLVKAHNHAMTNVTQAQIDKAVEDSIPQVAPLFWTFRIMVGIGFLLLVVFACAFYFAARDNVETKRGWLKVFFWILPLPWIAAECGWFIADFGRQPWAVGEILPTSVAVSNLSVAEIVFSLGLISLLYTVFLVIEVYLMVHFTKKGPTITEPNNALPKQASTQAS